MKTIKNLIIATTVALSFNVQASDDVYDPNAKYSSPTLCLNVGRLSEALMVSRQLGAPKRKLLNDVASTHGASHIVEDAYKLPKVSRSQRDSIAQDFGELWYLKCMNEGV